MPELVDVEGFRRIVFHLDGHALIYRDLRKITGLQLAERESDVDALLSPLGPDALTVDRSAFCR